MSPSNPMALRLSANLMVGIVRIHRQQTHYTYSRHPTSSTRLYSMCTCILQLSRSTCGRGSRVRTRRTDLQPTCRRVTQGLVHHCCHCTHHTQCLVYIYHSRSDTVTLPDPTSLVTLNTTFPGSDYSFSLDSLLVYIFVLCR